MPVPGEFPVAYIPNTADNTVSVIDTGTNTVIATVDKVGVAQQGAALTPRGIAAVPGGNVYVTNPGDLSVSVIDTATKTVVDNVTVGNYPLGVAVTPDGSLVYVGNTIDQTVSVIQTTSNYQVIQTLTVQYSPCGLAVTPDGSRVYVATGSDVAVIEPGPGLTGGSKLVATVQGLGQATGLAVSPAGPPLVWVADSAQNAVWAIDTSSNKLFGPIPVGASPWGVAVTPDGFTVYVTNSQDASVSVISVGPEPTESTVLTINLPSGSMPGAVSVSPTGNFAYVTDGAPDQAHGSVWLIDTATNELVQTLEAGADTGSGTWALGQFVSLPELEPVRDPLRPVV